MTTIQKSEHRIRTCQESTHLSGTMVMNLASLLLTSSTLMFSFALVSNSWMPICCAKVWASAVSTTFLSGSSFLFPTGKAVPKAQSETHVASLKASIQWKDSAKNVVFKRQSIWLYCSTAKCWSHTFSQLDAQVAEASPLWQVCVNPHRHCRNGAVALLVKHPTSKPLRQVHFLVC